MLIFLSPKIIFVPIKNFFITIAYPFEKFFYISSKKISNTFEFLGSISKLRSENERLIRENMSLTSQLASLSEEKRENESLRQQLGLLPRNKYNLEAGIIIGQDPQKLGSWLAIDKGSTSGITSGMPVIVSDGIIIGKISETNISSSKIDLLTSSSSSINAVDLNTGAKGIVKGEFGLGVIMDMIAQTDIINIGDEIVTSGLGGDMPKGLLIGKVREIKITQDKLFQQALIIPQIKYSNLDEAFVIKNNK